MPVIFSIEEWVRYPSWLASDYFVSDRTLTGIVLGERDLRIMSLLFENKIISGEQMGSQFRLCCISSVDYNMLLS